MKLKNKLVLIIDSDDMTLKMLDMYFKSAGATVWLERDCEGAYSFMNNVTPDVVILNINEFDMDDNEHCRQIKEKFCRVTSPVIITSTMSVKQFEERASDIGAIDYFQKPYSSLDLFTTVSKALNVGISLN